MHPRLRQVAAAAFLTFVLLWAVGIVHGLTQPLAPAPAWQMSSVSSGEEYFNRNAQQINNLKQLGLAGKGLPFVLDQVDVERVQVHEKTANLVAGTAAFTDDESRIRAALTRHGANVLNETNSGIQPGRMLTLEIGVPPEKFDTLVEDLREVGQLSSASVQQRDRTGDFRRLHAQRLALKKHLEAVLKLRGVGKGSVDDSLKVEQKVQDIEKELQALGVQLGDFLGKESFYNVRLTLSENKPGGARMGQAFLWAATWWFACAGVVGVLVGTFVSAQTLWPRRSA